MINIILEKKKKNTFNFTGKNRILWKRNHVGKYELRLLEKLVDGSEEQWMLRHHSLQT